MALMSFLFRCPFQMTIKSYKLQQCGSERERKSVTKLWMHANVTTELQDWERWTEIQMSLWSSDLYILRLATSINDDEREKEKGGGTDGSQRMLRRGAAGDDRWTNLKLA